MLTYGFTTCQLPEIYATLFPENQASVQVLHKAGMSWLRNEIEADGTVIAVYVRHALEQRPS